MVPVARDLVAAHCQSVVVCSIAATCRVLESILAWPTAFTFMHMTACNTMLLINYTTCIIDLNGALQVVVNDHVSKAVTLVNAGSLMYEYHWKLSAAPHLAVTPLAGSVGAGARALCKLTFNPTAAQQLNQHKVTCQVINGRSYSLLLSGQSYLLCCN